jgi:hypothetical protein
MNSTTALPLSAPEGFTVDPENPNLYWGKKIEADHYYIHLTWNAATREAELHSEIGDLLPVEAMLNLAVDLAMMAGVVRNLEV